MQSKMNIGDKAKVGTFSTEPQKFNNGKNNNKPNKSYGTNYEPFDSSAFQSVPKTQMYEMLKQMQLDNKWSKESKFFGKSVEAEEYISDQFNIVNKEILEHFKNEPNKLAQHIRDYNHVRYIFIPNIMSQIKEKLSPETFGIRNCKKREQIVSSIFRLMEEASNDPSSIENVKWVNEADYLFKQLELLSELSQQPFSETELKSTENNVEAVMTSILPQIEKELQKIGSKDTTKVEIKSPDPEQEEKIYDFLSEEYISCTLIEFYIEHRDSDPEDEKLNEEHNENSKIGGKFWNFMKDWKNVPGIAFAGWLSTTTLFAPAITILANMSCQAKLISDSLSEWSKYLSDICHMVNEISPPSGYHIFHSWKQVRHMVNGIYKRVFDQISEDLGFNIKELWTEKLNTPEKIKKAGVFLLKAAISIILPWMLGLVTFGNILSDEHKIDLNPNSSKMEEYINSSIFNSQIKQFQENLTASEALYKANAKHICESFVSNETKQIKFGDLIKIVKKNGTADKLIYNGIMTDKYLNDNTGAIFNMTKELNPNCQLPDIQDGENINTTMKLTEMQVQHDIKELKKQLKQHDLRNQPKVYFSSKNIKELESLKTHLRLKYKNAVDEKIKTLNQEQTQHYRNKLSIFNEITGFYQYLATEILSEKIEDLKENTIREKLITLITNIHTRDKSSYDKIVSSDKKLEFLTKDPDYQHTSFFSEVDKGYGTNLIKGLLNKVFKSYLDELFPNIEGSPELTTRIKAKKMLDIFNNSTLMYQVWVKRKIQKDGLIDLMNSLCRGIVDLQDEARENINVMKEKIVLERIGNNLYKDNNPVTKMYSAWYRTTDTMKGITKNIICSNFTSQIYNLCTPNTFTDYILGNVSKFTPYVGLGPVPNTNQLYSWFSKQLAQYFASDRVMGLLNEIKSYIDLLFLGRFSQVYGLFGEMFTKIGQGLRHLIPKSKTTDDIAEDVDDDGTDNSSDTQQESDPFRAQSKDILNEARKQMNGANKNNVHLKNLAAKCSIMGSILKKGSQKISLASTTEFLGDTLQLFGVFTLKSSLIYTFDLVLRSVPHYLGASGLVIMGTFLAFTCCFQYLLHNNSVEDGDKKNPVFEKLRYLFFGGSFIYFLAAVPLVYAGIYPVYHIVRVVTTFTFGLSLLGTSKQIMKNFRDCTSVSNIVLYTHHSLLNSNSWFDLEYVSKIVEYIPDLAGAGLINAIYNGDIYAFSRALYINICHMAQLSAIAADMLLFMKVFAEAFQAKEKDNTAQYYEYIYSNTAWEKSQVPTSIQDARYGITLDEISKNIKKDKIMEDLSKMDKED